MARVVVIMGAGSSVCANAPIMRDFLDVALRVRDRIRDRELPRDEEVVRRFREVFHGMDELQRVCAKVDLDQSNLESVFSAFEMAALLGTLGDAPERDVAELPQAMKSVIAITLAESILLPLQPEDGQAVPHAPSPHNHVAETLDAVVRATGSAPAVLTFNYDACMEFALSKLGIGYSQVVDRRVVYEVQLLKLHGSLLWGQCPKCLGAIEAFAPSARSMPSRAENRFVPLETPLWPTPPTHECGETLEPYIVPPSWSKREHYAGIQQVWQSAARELNEAEHIFVFGYSLPETDHFFRHLLGIGTIGSSWIKTFYVYDPEPAVEDRFRRLLGLNSRSRFAFFPWKFEGSRGAIDRFEVHHPPHHMRERLVDVGILPKGA